MAKKINFYSKQEIAVLKELIKKYEKINEKVVDNFCKIYSRNPKSVIQKCYAMKRNTSAKRKSNKSISNLLKKDTVFVPKKNAPIRANKGEFRVPINSWNISQEKDSLYLVVKF